MKTHIPLSFLKKSNAGVITLAALLLLQGTAALAAEAPVFENETARRNANAMVLDADNTGGDVTLQFGDTLGEQVYWDNTGGQFVFTDDVQVQGNLDVQGNVDLNSNQLIAARIENISSITCDASNAGRLYFDTDDNTSWVCDGSSIKQIDSTTSPTAWNDIQDATAAATVDFSTFTQTVDLGVTDTGGPKNGFVFDVTGLGNGSTDVTALKITTATDDDPNYIPFEVRDDSGAANDLLFQIGSTGAILTPGVTGENFTLDTNDTGGTVSLTFGNTVGAQLSHDGTIFHFNDTVQIDSASSLQFRDSALSLHSSVDGQLDIDADTEVEITTPTVDLNGNLDVSGDIIMAASQTVDGVDISALDSSVSSHLNGGSNKHDASEIDVETVGNITTVADLETNLGAFDTAIGNQTYTNDNYVIDGQSLTASVNALDTALGNSTKAMFVGMNDLTVVADGSANAADLYSDNDTTNLHQFYNLKTTQSALQDLDLKFKIRLPADFVNFSNANDLTFSYRTDTTTSTENKIDILVEDNDGDDAFTAADGQGLVSSVANTWATYTDEFDGAGFDPAAGEYIYVTVKGYGSLNGATERYPDMGEIVISYTGSNK